VVKNKIEILNFKLLKFKMNSLNNNNLNMEEKVVGLDNNENDMISLKRGDKTVYSLPRNYLYLSLVWKTALESDISADSLDCDSIDPKALEYVVNYLNVRKGEYISIGLSDFDFLDPKERNEKQEENKYTFIVFDDLDDYVKTRADIDFIKSVSRGKHLNNLIEVANYLNIPSLLHLCAMQIACLCQGVQIEEIDPYLSDENYQLKKKPENNHEPEEAESSNEAEAKEEERKE